MSGKAFIEWYKDQLCPHPTEACHLMPGKIVCGNCCQVLTVTARDLRLYRDYHTIPKELK